MNKVFKDDIYAIVKGFNNVSLISTNSEDEIIQIIDTANSDCHNGMILIYDLFLGLISNKQDEKIQRQVFEKKIQTLENILQNYYNFLFDNYEKNILIIKNANYIKDFRFWRALISSKKNLADCGKKVILLTPSLENIIPLDFKRDIFFYEHKLPNYETRKTYIESFLKSVEKQAKTEFVDIKSLPDISAGLTLKEIDDGIKYSISLYDNSRNINKKVIYVDAALFKTFKQKTIEKNSKIRFLSTETTFDDICGLDLLKRYIQNRFKKNNLPKSGIILVGIPGTGKTMFANALANYLKIPSVSLDASAIFNKAIGESEKTMKASIDIIDSIGKCVLIIDEIEKIIGGVASSNRTDGGTANRVFEILLNWLNDKNREAYVIATSNDIDELPTEFLRAGRWDNIFMVDMPNDFEIKQTFKKKCEKYKIQDWENHYILCKNKGFLENITGAEIEQLIIEYCYTLDENEKNGDWNEAYKFITKIYLHQRNKVENIKKKIGQYISASEQISLIDEFGNLIQN